MQVTVVPPTICGPGTTNISTSYTYEPLFLNVTEELSEDKTLSPSETIRIARDWNVKASGVGYVTRFQVRRDHLEQYEVQQVGGQTILEYWIPAERLEELNDNIVGTIEVVHTFR